jgi:polygalacturonase
MPHSASSRPAAKRPAKNSPGIHDVRAYGAVGDGRTLDTDAINRAIEAAAAAGGGTVFFPAGTYLSFSIRLQSNIALHLDQGATLLAAKPADGYGRYDEPEPNEWDMYQDFGHSHWHNSLIWGEGLENVSIFGPGRIHGQGLTRRGPGPRRAFVSGDMPLSLGTTPAGLPADDPMGEGEQNFTMDGQGNKAIALKLCRNVTLRDFSLLRGGHFCLLASGVDNLTIDNLRLDTNRDALDIDSCHHVRIANCTINTPNDDAIVLKSGFGLGYARATENVTIVNCQVTGFDFGSMLDGTYQRTQEFAPDKDRVTGRIKCGTESNGGFKNITVANCVFQRSRGFALETVDGGDIEDVTVTNLVMREITTAPLFLRIGNRGRGPGQPPIGAIRRVTISNVVVSGAESRFASLICGLPGHPVEDVCLSNIRIAYEGGGTKADAAIEPPELERAYPEPSMFGTIPAYGLYARHVKGLTLRDVVVSFEKKDERPAVVLNDVADAFLDHVKAQLSPGVPLLVARDVVGLMVRNCPGAPEV